MVQTTSRYPHIIHNNTKYKLLIYDYTTKDISYVFIFNSFPFFIIFIFFVYLPTIFLTFQIIYWNLDFYQSVAIEYFNLIDKQYPAVQDVREYNNN